MFCKWADVNIRVFWYGDVQDFEHDNNRASSRTKSSLEPTSIKFNSNLPHNNP